MSTYIGITIGPIYKTISQAKKTRELWGASYIFSYIMKQIYIKLKSNNAEIIIPQVDDSALNAHEGVGLFHDRIIFKSTKGDFTHLKDITDKILEDIGEEIGDVGYLKKYISITYCEIESDEEYKEINRNINNYLDNLELRGNYQTEEKSCLINYFTNKLNNSFLIKDAFGDKRKNFPTLLEIALSDLLINPTVKEMVEKYLDDDLKRFKDIKGKGNDKEIDEEQDETSIYQKLQDLSKKKEIPQLKKYHKYIAVVQADGDSLGDTIKSLTKNEDFEKLSKALFTFAIEANKLICNYSGVSVFAGGDDLLFFAPVVNKIKDKNIFILIDELNKVFNDTMKEALFNNRTKPTMSFGLSISYYKYPLNEARNAAYEQLKKAKHFSNKNSLAFKLLKHSGQPFEAVIDKNDEIYKLFLEFIKLKDVEFDTDTPYKILTSVAQKTFFI